MQRKVWQRPEDQPDKCSLWKRDDVQDKTAFVQGRKSTFTLSTVRSGNSLDEILSSMDGDRKASCQKFLQRTTLRGLDTGLKKVTGRGLDQRCPQL